jgi:catechol-2,3-dioxygenase
MSGISVLGLDHVHVHVADREKSAAWFERILGLQRDSELSDWATDPKGPLFLSTGEGKHCLALVQGNAEHNRIGDHTVAFNVCAGDFLNFLDHLDDLQLTDRDGSKVTKNDVDDHNLSWSLYFLDPDGNRIELTSYDYEEIGARMNKSAHP